MPFSDNSDVMPERSDCGYARAYIRSIQLAVRCSSVFAYGALDLYGKAGTLRPAGKASMSTVSTTCKAHREQGEGESIFHAI